MLITSTSNPTIKTIRKLLDRKHRIETGLFLIEGLRTVAEAIASNYEINSIVVSPDLLISDFGKSLLQECDRNKITVIETSSEVFMSISQKDGPQGIAAVCKQQWTNLNDLILYPNDIWVALESVQNPGNLGTILRTCDAVGGKGIILLENSTDPYDPQATKASMGSIFNLKLVKTDFEFFKDWIIRRKIHLIGTSDKAVNNVFKIKFPNPLVLLMGSERQGLSSCYLDLCKKVVQIPMEGKCDSLNLATATSVVLYQIYNSIKIQKNKEPR